MTASAPDREKIIARLDEIVQELLSLRRMLEVAPQQAGPEGLAERLFGSLGHGTWDECDQDLDWARFATP